MASVSESMLNQLRATNGKPITCKAAVAWKPKTPLDVTDIQVRYKVPVLYCLMKKFKSLNFYQKGAFFPPPLGLFSRLHHIRSNFLKKIGVPS